MQALGRSGEAPEQCTPEVMHDIVQQHLDSPAMWAIFPLQVRAEQQSTSSCTLQACRGSTLLTLSLLWAGRAHPDVLQARPL